MKDLIFHKIALFLILTVLISNFTNCAKFNSKLTLSTGSKMLIKALVESCNISQARVNEYLQSLKTIQQESKSKACTSKICRGWMEQSLLALCKAEEFRKKAQFPVLEPVHVAFRTNNSLEYSRFIFNLNVDNDIAKQDSIVQKGLKGKLLLRACISVDRSKKSYIDYKCPLANCTDFELVDQCTNQVLINKKCKDD